MSDFNFGYGIRPIRNTGAGGGARYWGKHRGLVVASNDPQMLGRVRATVPSLFGDEPTNWADPCVPGGMFSIPKVGQGVWIEFEDGDPEMPIWSGMWFRPAEAPMQSTYDVLQTDDEETTLSPEDLTLHRLEHNHTDAFYSPHKQVWYSRTGHFIMFDDWKGADPLGRVTIGDRDGRTVTLSEDGYIEIQTGTGDNNVVVRLTDDGHVYLGGVDGAKKLMTEDDAQELTNLFLSVLAVHTHPFNGSPPTNAIEMQFTAHTTTKTQAT
jgi:hypothetical protein